VIALVATTGVLADSVRGKTPLWMPESVGQWAPLFEEAAERHGVDPALLSIVTLVESRGNPEAVSSWGAVGLMQIMPRTAEKIAQTRGITTFDLADPATNIDLGAWYLARQIEAFGDGRLSDATIKLAATAYNGGPKRLRRHLDQGAELSDESVHYSDLVRALWRDREKARSEAFNRLAGRGR
jgi:soluble lytic murein transglycosylase-like protein